MRYHLSAAVLATTFLVACCQCLGSLASDSSVELIERLKPLAFWKLDDSERVILDETDRFVGLLQGDVRRARDGALQNGVDGALSFDGHDGCVVVRHGDEFLLDRGSVVCWVRAAEVVRTQGILSKDANGFGDGGHLTISIDQGKIVVRLQSTTESHELRADIRKQRWTHVAFTFGSQGMRFYVDGQLIGSHAYPGGLDATSGGAGNREPLVLGASTMTSQAASELPLASFFQGDLDDVAIFARQLGAAEIAELANAAKPRYRSLVRAYVAQQPTAWWRLDEPAGHTLAIDQAGQQHGSYHVVGASFFDGDDFVDLGTLDLDDTSFTLLAHVNPTSFAVSGARIVAKENGLNEADQFWSLSTTIWEDDIRARFRLRTEDGTREAVSRSRGIDVNKPLFLAASYDGKMMRLYQDGELVNEVAHSGRPLTNSHCRVWIGDSPAGAGKRPFAGKIRDVAVLPEAISPHQIRAIFEASHAHRQPASVERQAAPTAAEVLEPLPTPPAPVPTPTSGNGIRDAAKEPFVHRCPLCDIRYREVLIRRVTLPGTIALPICEVPIGDSLYP